MSGAATGPGSAPGIPGHATAITPKTWTEGIVGRKMWGKIKRKYKKLHRKNSVTFTVLMILIKESLAFYSFRKDPHEITAIFRQTEHEVPFCDRNEMCKFSEGHA